MLCVLFAASLNASERQVTLYVDGAAVLDVTCEPIAGSAQEHQAFTFTDLSSAANHLFGFVPSTGEDVTVSMQLSRVKRVDQLDDIRVTASVHQGAATVAGVMPQLSASKGTIVSHQRNEQGDAEWLIRPSASGEYPLLLNYKGARCQRTALVYETMHPDLGQPIAIPGPFVNSEGWEDGLTVSPQGEWLFMQYGPFRPSGFVLHFGDLNHPWNTTAIGPYGPPYRPDFFTKRIVNGQIQHYLALAPSFGPIYSPPTLFYGFRRQADGSYAQPFLIALDDAEGANLGPYGMSFVWPEDEQNATAVPMVFSYNDNLDNLDTNFDVYATTIQLGQKNIIGKFSATVPITIDYFNATRLSFTDLSGEQGNAHLHQLPNGTIDSVWTDAERESKNLSVHTLSGTFPQGPWVSHELPEPIRSSAHQFQPFFYENHLYYSSDALFGLPSIMRAAYNGRPYHLSSSWSDPEVILQTSSSAIVTGEMWGAGESSIAVIDGVPTLFFVYVHIRGIENGEPDFDIDCGMVPLLPQQGNS